MNHDVMRVTDTPVYNIKISIPAACCWNSTDLISFVHNCLRHDIPVLEALRFASTVQLYSKEISGWISVQTAKTGIMYVVK
jgi:hypothetical protein